VRILGGLCGAFGSAPYSMQWGLRQTDASPQQGPSWLQRACIAAAAEETFPFMMTPAPALISRRPGAPQSGQRPEGRALIPSNFSKRRPQPVHSYS
jgi:hypothetical protein